jgi:hypothetical protein
MRLQTNALKTFELCESDFKTPDHARRQGAIRFKSGAYTSVREHFESDRNTSIRVLDGVLNSLFGEC